MALFFFLIGTALGVVAIACLLRFIFQLARVNPLNTVVASTRKLTDRFLDPVRSVVPSGRFVDTASLLVAWLAMSGRVGLQEWTFSSQSEGGQSLLCTRLHFYESRTQSCSTSPIHDLDIHRRNCRKRHIELGCASKRVALRTVSP